MVFDQVKASTEMIASAGEYDGLNPTTRRGSEEVDELVDCGHVKRVALCWAVQHNNRHAVIAVLDVKKSETAGVKVDGHGYSEWLGGVPVPLLAGNGHREADVAVDKR
jgi:hypothetical protein